jgi:hypothetical protein
MELREDLNPVIIRAASDLYGLSDLGATAERRPGRATGSRLRYDKLYWGMIVEWEWRLSSEAERDHAAQQALDYLALVRAEAGEGEAFTAVVCNGEHWAFLATDEEPDINLFSTRVLRPSERFEWRDNTAASCRRFLELIGSHRQQPVTAAALAAAFGPASPVARPVVTLLAEALAGRTLNDRADTLYREWRRSLDVVYGGLDSDEGGLTEPIRNAFGIGHKAPLGELLFSVHTYFSLVARLLAIEILGLSAREPDSQPTAWTSLSDDQLIEKLRGVDAGTIPSTITVHNLFEADVFSWYQGAIRGNVDLLNSIRDLLNTLASFALPRVAHGANPATDILRDLYQSLVPRPLRKALGEFLTPSWLAEACLDRLQNLGALLEHGRVVDPTCGTGTFLLPVLRDRIRRLRAASTSAPSEGDVQALLNDVVGFDINPVAVVAARVNFITALGNLTSSGTLRLPIWRADSILLPDAPPIQGQLGEGRLTGRPWRRLATSLHQPFPIPPAFAQAPRMAILRDLLETAMNEATASLSQAVFMTALDAVCGPGGSQTFGLDGQDWEDAREVAIELHDRIRRLKDTDRNGVWARIIESSFAPLFAGRFDVVVGNPPWLSWSNLPVEWREHTAVAWKRYGLWRIPRLSGQRAPRNLASTDMAALVFAVALDRYVAEGGIVALLMPQAIVTGDPGHRAFRQFRLRPIAHDAVPEPVDIRFSPVHLDDWSAIKPFAPEAANSPIFLAAKVHAPFTSSVKTTRWVRAVQGIRLTGNWSRVRPLLKPLPGSSGPVDQADPTSAWSFQADGLPPLIRAGSHSWEFGTGLHTRGANGVFFVRIISDAPGSVVVENIPSASRGHDHEIPARRGVVESELVYPLLRGRDVRRWLARPSGYIVAPHEPQDMGRVLARSAFVQRYSETWKWLRRFESVLALRKAPPNRSWNMSGDDWCRLEGPIQHMVNGYMVVVREQDDPPAAAICGPVYDAHLRRTSPVLVDHKLIFCAVNTRDEAQYLATLINSTPIQDLLSSFANTIAISDRTMARLPIPAFDPTRAEVQEVISAGQAALLASAAEVWTAANQHEVDEAVRRLLDLPSSYRPQPDVAVVSRPRRRSAAAGGPEQERLPIG